MIARDVREHQGARDVVPVILERLRHRFADGFEAREVDDDVDVVGGEDTLERIAVQDGGSVEDEVVVVGAESCDGAHAFDGDFAPELLRSSTMTT